MKPIKFTESNRIYAENQEDYLPLPAFVDPNDERGSVISCWKLSLKERIILLFTGKLWVALLMFGQPLSPSYFTVKKSDVIIKTKDEHK